MARLVPPVVAEGTMSGQPQPSIDVDGELVLRPWADNDVAAVLEAFSDPDIQFFHFRRFDDLDQAQEWINLTREGWQNETWANWAAVDRHGDAVLGRVGLHLHLVDGWAEIAYWVLPGARGRGVATRGAVALTAWAHEQGLHRIELMHSSANEASSRVARKAGFVPEGVLRGKNLHADGWHDMAIYSHLSDE